MKWYGFQLTFFIKRSNLSVVLASVPAVIKSFRSFSRAAILRNVYVFPSIHARLGQPRSQGLLLFQDGGSAAILKRSRPWERGCASVNPSLSRSCMRVTVVLVRNNTYVYVVEVGISKLLTTLFSLTLSCCFFEFFD